MARITEKIKIYIYKHVDTGVLGYFTVALEHCPWLIHVGTTEALIDFDESDLVDPRTAQLAKAERELEAHRAEFAVKERQLLGKVESLRALPHLGMAMTDQELLELAAKAAGINIFDWTPGGQPTTDGAYTGIWNPLTDDGDALRLAVQLNLDIRFDSCDAGIAVIVAGAWDDAPEGAHEIFERNGARATRRAIVRAAAEIGRAVP